MITGSWGAFGTGSSPVSIGTVTTLGFVSGARLTWIEGRSKDDLSDGGREGDVVQAESKTKSTGASRVKNMSIGLWMTFNKLRPGSIP